MFQWLFLVPLKGGRWHIIPQLAVYTTYIPLIYCLLGGYIIPTTFYGNQKQPLNVGNFQGVPENNSVFFGLVTYYMRAPMLEMVPMFIY